MVRIWGSTNWLLVLGAGSLMERQKAGPLVTWTARAPIDVRSRDFVVPARESFLAWVRAVAGLPSYWTITGSVLRWASSYPCWISPLTSNRDRSRRPLATSLTTSVGMT